MLFGNSIIKFSGEVTQIVVNNEGSREYQPYMTAIFVIVIVFLGLMVFLKRRRQSRMEESQNSDPYEPEKISQSEETNGKE